MKTAATMRSAPLAVGLRREPSTPPATMNEPWASSDASAMPSAQPMVPMPLPPATTTLAKSTSVSGLTSVKP